MFIPQKEGKGYDFRAKTRFDRLFSGVAMPKPSWVKDGDKRGTEHIGPEDTFDGDYGRALKKAQDRVKRMVSLSTPSWNQLRKWLSELSSIGPIVHAGRSEARTSP